VITTGIVVWLATHIPEALLPNWHRAAAGGPGFSLAGWWHILISLPLLVIVLLGWVWRWMLWIALLWRVAQCRLRLVCAHPDRAGGLRFVGYSARAFATLAFALGTIVAGSAANGIANAGVPPLTYKYVAPAMAAVVLILFGGPPVVFLRRMLSEWRSSTMRYGALADDVGRTFETRWLEHRSTEGEFPDTEAPLGPAADADAKAVLQVQDFSAMTDLYSVVANVYAMRLVPFDVRSVGLLVLCAVAPLVPVALLAVPFDTIVAWLIDLML